MLMLLWLTAAAAAFCIRTHQTNTASTQSSRSRKCHLLGFHRQNAKVPKTEAPHLSLISAVPQFSVINSNEYPNDEKVHSFVYIHILLMD